jgi:hypothetical protein
MNVVYHEYLSTSIVFAGRIAYAQMVELGSPSMNHGLAPDLAANEPSFDYGQKALDMACASYLGGKICTCFLESATLLSFAQSFPLSQIRFQTTSSLRKCTINLSTRWRLCQPDIHLQRYNLCKWFVYYIHRSFDHDLRTPFYFF